MDALDYLVDFADLINYTNALSYSKGYDSDHTKTTAQLDEPHPICAEKPAVLATIPGGLYDMSSGDWTGKQRHTPLLQFYPEALLAPNVKQERPEEQNMWIDQEPHRNSRIDFEPHPKDLYELHRDFGTKPSLGAERYPGPPWTSMYHFDSTSSVNKEVYTPYPAPFYDYNQAEDARQFTVLDRRPYRVSCGNPWCGCRPFAVQGPHLVGGTDGMLLRGYWYADPARFGAPSVETNERWSDMRMIAENIRMANAQWYQYGE
jgi:hypothetical protein